MKVSGLWEDELELATDPGHVPAVTHPLVVLSGHDKKLVLTFEPGHATPNMRIGVPPVLHYRASLLAGKEQLEKRLLPRSPAAGEVARYKTTGWESESLGADDIVVDASSFETNLDTTATDVQKALVQLDALSITTPETRGPTITRAYDGPTAVPGSGYEISLSEEWTAKTELVIYWGNTTNAADRLANQQQIQEQSILCAGLHPSNASHFSQLMLRKDQGAIHVDNYNGVEFNVDPRVRTVQVPSLWVAEAELDPTDKTKLTLKSHQFGSLGTGDVWVKEVLRKDY